MPNQLSTLVFVLQAQIVPVIIRTEFLFSKESDATMSITIDELYRETRQQFQLTLVAGAGGRNNIVNWIYIAEDIENIQFLQGGELVISTGFGSGMRTEWLLSLLQALIQKKTAGLILNIGKYISSEDITPEMTELCSQHDFPLFTIPWEIHLSDLSQNYCNRIFADRQLTCDLAGAMREILLEQHLSPHFESLLLHHGFLATDTYCLAVLEAAASEDRRSLILSHLRRAASFFPFPEKTNYLSFEFRNQLILIWHHAVEPLIRQHCSELISFGATQSDISGIWIGLSQCQNQLSQIPRLYQQALDALCIGKGSQTPLTAFDELNCNQLFFAVSDEQLLKDFYQKSLKKLEEYDDLHNSMYLKTLEYYLRFDGRLSDIADAMICHRNTINYRMNKIRELLQMDLNDGDIKFQLQLALRIRIFLNLRKAGNNMP